jgi:hypothetical protein
MHHTPESTVLSMPRHYEQASAGQQIPWSFAEHRLSNATIFWLATTRPNGSPHVTPVWGVWVDDSLYFTGIPTAAWARNLNVNANASIHLESGTEVVILDGWVEDLETVADPSIAGAIVYRWSEAYGKLVPDPVGDGMYCFRARTVRGWSRFPEDATKWTFEHRA